MKSSALFFIFMTLGCTSLNFIMATAPLDLVKDCLTQAHHSVTGGATIEEVTSSAHERRIAPRNMVAAGTLLTLTKIAYLLRKPKPLYLSAGISIPVAAVAIVAEAARWGFFGALAYYGGSVAVQAAHAHRIERRVLTQFTSRLSSTLSISQIDDLLKDMHHLDPALLPDHGVMTPKTPFLTKTWNRTTLKKILEAQRAHLMSPHETATDTTQPLMCAVS